MRDSSLPDAAQRMAECFGRVACGVRDGFWSATDAGETSAGVPLAGAARYCGAGEAQTVANARRSVHRGVAEAAARRIYELEQRDPERGAFDPQFTLTLLTQPLKESG